MVGAFQVLRTKSLGANKVIQESSPCTLQRKTLYKMEIIEQIEV